MQGNHEISSSIRFFRTNSGSSRVSQIGYQRKNTWITTFYNRPASSLPPAHSAPRGVSTIYSSLQLLTASNRIAQPPKTSTPEDLEEFSTTIRFIARRDPIASQFRGKIKNLGARSRYTPTTTYEHQESNCRKSNTAPHLPKAPSRKDFVIRASFGL